MNALHQHFTEKAQTAKMMHIWNKGGWLIVTVLSVAACTSGETDKGTPELPTFDEPGLASGERIWKNNCRACHLTGVAGAPSIHDGDAWRPRLAKGIDALYQSALQGIPAESGWKMPPRGGNARLSDTQVRQAVDYMTTAVSQQRVAD